ncbi:MAG TPA: ABC transporter permease [Terriglobales bacterium]|nr:ABC transporter permease [Terriglobales bacterium]
MKHETQRDLSNQSSRAVTGVFGSWLRDLFQDLHYGWRMFLKTPGFAVVAILTIALGIGASTAVFTIINTFILNSLPVRDTQRLAAAYAMPQTADAHATNLQPISFLDLKDYQEKNRVFSELAGYTSPMSISFSEGKGAERLFAEMVTGNYFETLGLAPVTGRYFSAAEDNVPGGDPVVVIGYGMWQRRFGGDQSAVGRLIYLNERPFTIVGVAPPAFKGINAIFGPDLWIPSMMAEQVLPAQSRNVLHERSKPFFTGVGRLRPGISMSQAEADLKTISATLRAEYPDADAARTVSLLSISDAALGSYWRQQMIFASIVLAAIVALVLLIACSNVANLLLARAAARRQEIAVRLAMGAGRSRLIRQLLTESLLLATLSGILGFCLAVGGTRLLWSFRPAEYAQNFVDLKVNFAVFAFTLVTSLASGLVFGIAPALESSRPGLMETLKEDTQGSGRSRRAFRLGNLLVVGQVALSLVSLITASLFLRSMVRASAIDPGFEADHLAVFPLNPGQVGYSKARTENFYRELRRRLLSQPGVVSVSWSSNLPLWSRALSGIVIEGKERERKSEAVTSVLSTVDIDYFSTMGIPVLRGRDFTEDDRDGSLPVTIINQAMATRYWPNQDAIGKRFRFPGENSYRQIVGIARNANYQTLGESSRSCIYVPLRQNFSDSMVLYLRTTGDPARALLSSQRVIHDIDPQLPVADARTGRRIIEQALWSASMGISMLLLFGAVGLALASIGLYGLLAYSVKQRQREIGIRMALGAGRGQVLRLILSQGLRLVSVGIGIGILLSIIFGRALSKMLYGVSAGDLPSITAASFVLFLIAGLACYLPARAASNVNPMAGLRAA